MSKDSLQVHDNIPPSPQSVGISTEQEKKKGNPNPSPSTRFGAENGNPRNPGGWKKEDSISYQYNKMLRMTVEEFKAWEKENPESERTVAQGLAYSAVVKARGELNYLKEVTDRTEGRAQQRITHDGSMNMDITRIADEIEKVITEDDNSEED